MKKRTLRILCCTLLLALLTGILPAFADSAAGNKTFQAYVTGNTMKVYRYPNQLSELLGTMSYGESVKVLAWQDGWIRVQNSKGKIGYCEMGKLSKVDPALDMFGYVKETGAFIHAKPGQGYKVIGTATLGDELHVVGMTKDKKWLRVRNGSNYGYVLTELMSRFPIWPDDASALLK